MHLTCHVSQAQMESLLSTLSFACSATPLTVLNFYSAEFPSLLRSGARLAFMSSALDLANMDLVSPLQKSSHCTSILSASGITRLDPPLSVMNTCESGSSLLSQEQFLVTYTVCSGRKCASHEFQSRQNTEASSANFSYRNIWRSTTTLTCVVLNQVR